MTIPTHIKKLAVEAVEGKETTEWMRAHNADTATGSTSGDPESSQIGNPRQAALKIVSQNETLRQVRLVEVDSISKPWPTPKPQARSDSDFLAELRRSAKSAAAALEAEHQSGREDVGRDHGR